MALIDDPSVLADRAWRLFSDPQRLRLRRKERFVEQVRHSRHPIDIPPSLAGRARPIYSGMGGELVDRAKALLRDPEGVRLEVAQVGISRRSELLRERVQAWLSGAMRQALFAGDRPLEDMILEDLLLRSRAYVRVLPNPTAWCAILRGMPVAEALLAAAPGDAAVADQDLGTGVTITPIPPPPLDFDEDEDENENENENEDDNEDREAARAVAEAERILADFAELRRRVFPLAVHWVPARAVIDLWDNDGLAEVYEIQLIPALQFVRNFRDGQGRPLSEELAEQISYLQLSESDMVTVLMRADREHLQIALVNWSLDLLGGLGTGELYPSATRRLPATTQILWQGPHDMGTPPYAVFRGRMTTAGEPAFAYRGFLDDAAKLIVRLDEILTQRHSSARWGAWPQLYIKKNLPTMQGGAAASLGGGDAQSTFEVREGGVSESLGPGEELVRVPWFDPEAQKILDQTEAQLRTDIQRHTLGPGAYGQLPAQSGYQQALLETAAAIHLEPFRRGAEMGYARLAELLIRAARALLRHGLPDIPVRYSTPDGDTYITLTKPLADEDWLVRATLITKPVGGDLALYQAVAFAEDRGYITHEEALRRIGDAYPQRTIAQRYAEQILLSPVVIQAAQQEVLRRALAALGQGAPAGLPNQPIIPQALAQTLGMLTNGAQAPPGPGPGPGPGGGPGPGPGPGASPFMPPELALRMPMPGVNSALLARGPGGPMGGIPGGISAGAGLPNLATPLMGLAGVPPTPPRRRFRPPVRRAGPAVTGQAQAAPGGVARARSLAAQPGSFGVR